MASSDSELLKKISEDYWQWRLEDVPEFATACNIHIYNNRLQSQTSGYFEEKVRRCQEFLQRLSEVHLLLYLAQCYLVVSYF